MNLEWSSLTCGCRASIPIYFHRREAEAVSRNSQQALVTPLTISRLDTMRHQEPPRKLEGQEGLIHRKLIRRASDSNIKHLDAAETMPVATPRPRFSPAAIGYSYLNTEPASNITVLRSRKFVKPTVSFHGNSMASKFIIRAGPLVKLRFDRFRKDQSEKCQQIGFGLILSIYLPLFFRESLSLAFFTFQVLVMTQTKNTLRCSLSFPNAVSANAEIFESARAGLTENVKYLLSLGKASAKDITIFGTTLLHSASNSGSMELVRLLIQEGADVNAQDEDGESPLHVAMARSENYNVARTLIENGADLSSKAVDGRTPFHTIFNSTISQVYMRDEWLERMIPDSEGMSITHFLAWSSKSTSEIFQRGRKFDDAGLLSADVMGRTCLHLAASRGNLKVLSYLLSQVLLAALEKKDNQGRTPFHYATESSRAAAVIDLLRDKGCNIYALDNTGRTALHWAARWNNFDAAKKLVALTSRGALLTSDISGRMPSREVCQRKAPDLYKYLRGLEEDSRGVAIQQ